MASQEDYGVEELCASLLKAAKGDLTLTAAIIEQSLTVLPAVTARKDDAGADLVARLLLAAKDDGALISTVSTRGLSTLPAITAERLLSGLAKAPSAETSRECLCQQFMILAPDSLDGPETIICFGATPEQTTVHSRGLSLEDFSGSLLDMQRSVESPTPFWRRTPAQQASMTIFQAREQEDTAPYQDYCRGVLSTAFQAFATPNTLPSFKEALAAIKISASVPV